MRSREEYPSPVSPGVDDSAWLDLLGLSSYVAIDLETTGLDATSDEIIEVGAVRFRDGRLDGEFRSFVHCDKPLAPFITELTGITNSDLQTAPAFRDIAPELLDFMTGIPISGHNVEFDLGFLRETGARNVTRPRENPFIFGGVPAMDTAMLARIFWPELPGFSLSALSASFGITLHRAHRALDDARATGELLAALVRGLPERVWRELALDLHRLLEPTTHRSRFFFAALTNAASNIRKPALEDLPAESGDAVAALPQSDLDRMFGSDGVFEHKLAFFRSRPVQLELARAVETALRDRTFLLAEAPTGVGKSLAYLTPSVYWALDNPEEARQVVVSSHTKVLQDQLFAKDVAELQQAVGSVFTAEVLKGRANYLCRRRLKLVIREAHERLSDSDRVALMPLLRWSELTKTGDISEINGFNPRHQPFLWAQVCSDSLACAGTACTSQKGDYYRAAQERAARAQIVFVNHALLLTDVVRYAGGSNRRLILDEAHQIERAMVGALAREFSAPILRNQLSRLIDERLPRGLLAQISCRLEKTAGGEITDRADSVIAGARNLHSVSRQQFALVAERLATMLGESERSSKLRLTPGLRLTPFLAEALKPLCDAWSLFIVQLADFIQRVGELRGEDKLPPELTLELRSALDLLSGTGSELSAVLQFDSANTVVWAEFGRSSNGLWCALCSAPVSVGDAMKQSLWPAVEGAVLTSATLTASGGFDVLRDSLGLPAPDSGRMTELKLGSPFRLPSQMRVLVPTYMPEPRQGGLVYAEAVARLAAAIVGSCERGTLILSTSSELVDRITSAVTPVARKSGRVVLSQGNSGSLNEMVAEFRRRGNAILVGAASFWEGIDVVGDALQILLITRLPFDVPTDPWVAARTESLQAVGRDSFLEYSVPVTAMRLKQGIGRLIRHPEDRGVAIVADPRLVRSRYGRIIQGDVPVPVMPVDSEQSLCGEINRFFKQSDHD